MADEPKTTATRIITDLRSPAPVRPKEHVVWSVELYREVGALAGADMELAHILDELDAKINSHDQATMQFAQDAVDAIEALKARCAALEGRTLSRRIRRAREWWAVKLAEWRGQDDGEVPAS